MLEQQNITMQQAIDLALEHHTAGRLPEAENIYQKILKNDPEQSVALHLLGVIAHQVGKNDVAVEHITKAIANRPDYAEAHCNLGLVLEKQGKLDESKESFCTAITIQPNYAEAYNNLGVVQNKQGKLCEAKASYQKAINIKPDYAEPYNNLGYVFLQQEKLDEVINICQIALAIKPNYAEAYFNIGRALFQQQKLDEAIESFRKTLNIKPDHAETYCILGFLFSMQGNANEALASCLKAVSIAPQREYCWISLAQSLEGFSFTSTNGDIYGCLLQLLKRNTACRPSRMVGAIISALSHLSSYSIIFNQTNSTSLNKDFSYDDAYKRLANIPLFLEIIKLTPIADFKIEKMLTVLRKGLLKNITSEDFDPAAMPFAEALSLQCFVNEYIYPVSDEEMLDIAKIEKKIVKIINEKNKIPSPLIVILGAYKPLLKYIWAEELLENLLTSDIKEVIERQISQPIENQTLRSQIPCLTQINNVVSQAVREQYEENPYPTWVKTMLLPHVKTSKSALHEYPLSSISGKNDFPESPDILIAGCGTGQHSIFTASRFVNSKVLALDLSLSNLSFAQRKTNELGFSNIEYKQADIMELETFTRQFDIIESIGVLHHLADPLAGWKVLEGLLRPNGIMMIGLYSEIARTPITQGQSVIHEKGYAATPEDIRSCRQTFFDLVANGNEEIEKIIKFRDFFSMSECRDLLFHVQEHRFTLPQIRDALKSLNLKFIGFEFGDKVTMKKFKSAYPQKDALNSLSLWDEFEINNPDTFTGMYQFWCQKIS